MEKIKRFYNQNRKKIHKWLIIIGVFILVTRVANLYYIQENNTEKKVSTNYNDIKEISSQNNTNNTSYKKSNSSIINTFIDYCKNKEYSKAYEMLYNETKEEKIYGTEEAFINNFINAFLETGNKLNIIEINALKNIYEIEVYNSNIISTGNTDSIKYKYIKEIDKKIKLQEYIIEKNINKKSNNDNVYINIKKLEVFKDISNFNISIMNNSNSVLDFSNIYLVAKGEKKYKLDMIEKIGIAPFENKKVDLKFNIKYTEIDSISKIVFEKNNEKIEIEL